MSEQIELSVVIPTFNEQERVVPTIAAFVSHLDDHFDSWEIIISDDGSTDLTRDFVNLIMLHTPQVRLVTTPANTGKGGAVRRGVNHARGEFVLFADADNATPVQELTQLMEAVSGGADVAVGSRRVPGADVGRRSLGRRVATSGLHLVVQSTLGIRVADTQCGFKLFTRESAKTLFMQQTIEGFSFDLELLHLATKRGFRIVEVPVSWFDVPGSKVQPVKEALRFLASIRLIRQNAKNDLYGDFTKPTITVVTALTPSHTTLNEYGYHFLVALGQKPGINVVALVERIPVTYPHIDGVRVVPVWKFGSLLNPWRIARHAKRLRSDLTIVNAHFTSFGSTKVSAALGLTTPVWLRAKHIPVITLLHNIMETVNLSSAGFMMNRFTENLIRALGTVVTWVVLRSSLVTTTMPHYVDVLRTKYRATNVALTPHGAFTVPPLTVEEPSPTQTVMTFGKFGTYKQVDMLIEAVRSLNRPNLKLIIAGTDSPNTPGYLAKMQEKYGGPDVQFTGYVAEEDVEDLFRNATVTVFPYTATTGSSGVLHQAGTYGCAPVLPKVGDLEELVRHEGYTGEFFEPDDRDSLANAIQTLLDDPLERLHIIETNYAAATSLPLTDVSDWYLLHASNLTKTPAQKFLSSQ